jgi:two-component system LytT family response regulator
MLRAIIIDDEQAGIDVLKVLIERNSSLMRIVASTLDPAEGIALIHDFHPDVVFLDVSMPAMNGFELLAQLHYHDFKLVFTTAHRDYAIQAIKNKAFDYLLKPIDQADFLQCIQNIAADSEGLPALKKEAQVYLELLVKDGIQYIKLEEIIRLEASRSYTVFYLEGGVRHIASRSMKEFETRLDAGVFYRCHHSHIVNLQKVQKFVNHQGYFALMKDGSMADIAKRCKDPFLDRLKSL